MENFNKDLYLDILEKLAVVKGPSLDESERIDILKDLCVNYDVPFRMDAAGNLILPVKEGNRQDAVIFDAHIDVAGKGYAEKFIMDDEFVRGQGVADNLTNAVFLFLLALSLKDKKLKRPFYILFSTGEEGEGCLHGIKQFISDFKEPPYLFTAFDLSFKTVSFDGLGAGRFKVDVTTKGGHSYENFGSPNAIEILSMIILSLKENLMNITPSPTFNTGSISGGGAINLIADRASANVEFRTVHSNVMRAGEDLLDGLKTSFSSEDVNINIEDAGSRPASKGSYKEDLYNLFSPVFFKNGIKFDIRPMSTNINPCLYKGWRAFCTGLCECGNFHTEDEYVLLNSLDKGWRLLNDILKISGVI